jgi:hypothetical protein
MYAIPIVFTSGEFEQLFTMHEYPPRAFDVERTGEIGDWPNPKA